MRLWGLLFLFICAGFCQARPVSCREVMQLVGLMAYRVQHQAALDARTLKSVERRIRELKKRTGFDEKVELPSTHFRLDDLLETLRLSLYEDLLVNNAQAARLTTGVLRRMLAEEQAVEEQEVAIKLIQNGLTDTSEHILAVMLWRSDIVDINGWLGAPRTEGDLTAMAKLLALGPNEAIERLKSIPLADEGKLANALDIAAYETVYALTQFHVPVEPAFLVADLEKNFSLASLYAKESFGKYLNWYLLRKAPLFEINNLRSLKRYLAVD